MTLKAEPDPKPDGKRDAVMKTITAREMTGDDERRR
jgi:hypothetical protein